MKKIVKEKEQIFDDWENETYDFEDEQKEIEKIAKSQKKMFD